MKYFLEFFFLMMPLWLEGQFLQDRSNSLKYVLDS